MLHSTKIPALSGVTLVALAFLSASSWAFAAPMSGPAKGSQAIALAASDTANCASCVPSSAPAMRAERLLAVDSEIASAKTAQRAALASANVPAAARSAERAVGTADSISSHPAQAAARIEATTGDLTASLKGNLRLSAATSEIAYRPANSVAANAITPRADVASANAATATAEISAAESRSASKAPTGVTPLAAAAASSAGTAVIASDQASLRLAAAGSVNGIPALNDGDSAVLGDRSLARATVEDESVRDSNRRGAVRASALIHKASFAKPDRGSRRAYRAWRARQRSRLQH